MPSPSPLAIFTTPHSPAGDPTEPQAIAATQQGHRNFSKRQQTWFRREAELHPSHTLHGFGDSPAIQHHAFSIAAGHLHDTT